MTPETMKKIYIHARPESLEEFAGPITECMDKYEINTPLRQAHFLAQIGHESGELRYREEIASGAAYENRADLGNVEEGDGKRFKGRGLIQLTGRANYRAYSQDCGFDLLQNPRLLEEDTNLCADVAGWFWKRRGLNKIADADNILTITVRINGGRNGLENRKRLLELAKDVLL
jgi:predicted chitinase